MLEIMDLPEEDYPIHIAYRNGLEDVKMIKRMVKKK